MYCRLLSPFLLVLGCVISGCAPERTPVERYHQVFARAPRSAEVLNAHSTGGREPVIVLVLRFADRQSALEYLGDEVSAVQYDGLSESGRRLEGALDRKLDEMGVSYPQENDPEARPLITYWHKLIEERGINVFFKNVDGMVYIRAVAF